MHIVQMFGGGKDWWIIGDSPNFTLQINDVYYKEKTSRILPASDGKFTKGFHRQTFTLYGTLKVCLCCYAKDGFCVRMCFFVYRELAMTHMNDQRLTNM